MNPFQPGQNVFQSQADERFNSFASPLNSVNTNPGPWGLDPNYLTPSYMSPYRPRFNGTQPGLTGTDPGFFRSVNHILNPFERGGTNYGGNSYAQNRSYYDSIGMRPMDAATVAVQFGTQIGASMGAYRMLGRYGASFGEGIGQGIGSTMSRGITSPQWSTNIAKMGGTIGRVGGSVVFPLMAAQAAVSGLDSAVFDPYLAQRQMSNNFRDNFSGISMGDGSGNAINGRGFSRGFASNMSRSMSVFAGRDVTFNQSEVANISDLSARAGLLDSVNGNQMSHRLKEITRQVKVVMSIANTSDFREAVEIISKLHHSGVSHAGLPSAMGRMGGLASVAGISTQRLMDTVGAQGQYLFQANGLTPYVGQMASGRALASFSTAYRSGLISPALMARMGGREGAAQSATAGLLGMIQTPYSVFSEYNAMNGGRAGSVVGNMTNFGASMANGTLSALGNFNMLSPALMSNAASTSGLGGQMQRLREIGQTIPGAMKNGRMDAGAAFMILTSVMGLPPDQARAVLQQSATASPGQRGMTMAGFDSASIDLQMKTKDQLGLNRGIFTTPIAEVSSKFRAAQAHGAGIMGGFLSNVASTMDSFETGMTSALYGTQGVVNANSFSSSSIRRTIRGRRSRADMLSDAGSFYGVNAFDMKKRKYTPMLNSINDLASYGDSDAVAYLRSVSSKDPKQRSRAREHLRHLINKGAISSEDASGINDSEFSEFISKYTSEETNYAGALSRISKSLADTLPGKGSAFQRAEMISLADRVHFNPNDDESISKLETMLGRSLSHSDLTNLTSSVVKAEAMHGTMNVPAIFESLGMSSSDLDVAWKDAKSPQRRKLNSLVGGRGVTQFKSQQELLAAMGSKMGLNVVDRGLGTRGSANIDAGASANFIQGMRGIAKERSMNASLAKNNFIDMDSFMAKEAALDTKESSMTFSDAVDRFGKAVDSISGNKAGNSDWVNSLPIIGNKYMNIHGK